MLTLLSKCLVQVSKFSRMVDAIGADTLASIATAGPETQVHEGDGCGYGWMWGSGRFWMSGQGKIRLKLAKAIAKKY